MTLDDSFKFRKLVAKVARCRICGRPLKDPKSIALGIGKSHLSSKSPGVINRVNAYLKVKGVSRNEAEEFVRPSNHSTQLPSAVRSSHGSEWGGLMNDAHPSRIRPRLSDEHLSTLSGLDESMSKKIASVPKTQWEDAGAANSALHAAQSAWGQYMSREQTYSDLAKTLEGAFGGLSSADGILARKMFHEWRVAEAARLKKVGLSR